MAIGKESGARNQDRKATSSIKTNNCLCRRCRDRGACNVFEIKTSPEGNLYARKMEAKIIELKKYSARDMETYGSETPVISNHGK